MIRSMALRFDPKIFSAAHQKAFLLKLCSFAYENGIYYSLLDMDLM